MELNKEYIQLLREIKLKIKSSQIKAAIHVNKELLQLYWYIGKRIVEKQRISRWGDNIINSLAKDLCKEFPSMKGFSRANLFNIRQWYLFYSKSNGKVQQLVGQIPWGHNIAIINKTNDFNEAIFYVKCCINNSWSRNILIHNIENRLFNRKGKSLNNFKTSLPKKQSDLAIECLKDPYIFDFLNYNEKFNEKMLEDNLISKITRFLLELGSGFSYVGKQYHIELEGEDYYIDLLFYHLKLRCYIAIELKIGGFKPEYVGKMNFYLSLLDEKLKFEKDNSSIGLILCKNKNKITAEYALRNFNRPIAVSGYNLPSKKEIEKELRKELNFIK